MSTEAAPSRKKFPRHSILKLDRIPIPTITEESRKNHLDKEILQLIDKSKEIVDKAQSALDLALVVVILVVAAGVILSYLANIVLFTPSNGDAMLALAVFAVVASVGVFGIVLLKVDRDVHGLMLKLLNPEPQIEAV